MLSVSLWNTHGRHLPECLRIEPLQVKKVVAVALAVFLSEASMPLIFGCMTWAFIQGQVLPSVCLAASVTWFCELMFRKGKEGEIDWFQWQKDITVQNFLNTVVRITAFRICLIVLFPGVLGVVVQPLAVEVLSGNLALGCWVMFGAPLVEEILFRGFLQERLEDGLSLVRTICPSFQGGEKVLAAAITSLIFGWVHITPSQGVHSSYKPFVFVFTGLLGVCCSLQKELGKSLVVPIEHHSLNNSTFLIAQLVASKFLMRGRAS